eukprot:4861653-Pyramimonas_sp.AAC.1
MQSFPRWSTTASGSRVPPWPPPASSCLHVGTRSPAQSGFHERRRVPSGTRCPGHAAMNAM